MKQLHTALPVSLAAYVLMQKINRISISAFILANSPQCRWLTSLGCSFGGLSSTVRKSGLGTYAESEDAINRSIVGLSLFPSAPIWHSQHLTLTPSPCDSLHDACKSAFCNGMMITMHMPKQDTDAKDLDIEQHSASRPKVATWYESSCMRFQAEADLKEVLSRAPQGGNASEDTSPEALRYRLNLLFDQ